MHSNTLIIGAGPAGLAVAGRLTKLGLPFLMLEKNNQIGDAWQRHYDRVCLHTVKEHSDLPHLPMPEHYPVYVPRLDLIAYWQDYARQMGILPLAGQHVNNIRRDNARWVVTTQTGTFTAGNVVVCSGYNRVPNFPTWPGQEIFGGTILHSSEYRNADPFRGKCVLLIGIGNTGAELALDLYEKGAFPTISVRGPVNFIRRDLGGRPAQRTAILLGKLPNWAFDFISKQVQKLTVGDLAPYGIPASPYAPSEQLRRFGKVPVIDIGTIELIKQRKVVIRPDIRSFQADGVTFANGQTEPFDAVIACTGYRAQVEDFVTNAQPLLNERGYPSQLWFDDDAFRGLYFCGFSTPLSGILRNIKMDSEKIVEQIRRVNVPATRRAPA